MYADSAEALAQRGHDLSVLDQALLDICDALDRNHPVERELAALRRAFAGHPVDLDELPGVPLAVNIAATANAARTLASAVARGGAIPDGVTRVLRELVSLNEAG
jgi:hypothetical protein